MRAVSLGPDLPRALRGHNEAVAINNLNDFKVRDTRGASDLREHVRGHARSGSEWHRPRDFRRHEADAVDPEAGLHARGRRALSHGKLGQNLKQIARLIKADVGLEVAFTDVGGWDHHVNEVGAKSTVGPARQPVDAISARRWRRSTRTWATAWRMSPSSRMSEFGRTAKENGTRGTDHGHANVMFAFGGGIKGGKIYGDWPGMEREQLYEDRDLNLTTDFRDVLGELVTRQLGNTQINKVFPGYDQPKFRGIFAG